MVLLILWWTVFGRVGPILEQSKPVRGDHFFAAKIGPPGPVLGGTDFAVTVLSGINLIAEMVM